MLNDSQIEKNKQEFIGILSQVNRPGIQNLIDWLSSDECDFFLAPSSSTFHGNYKGGLCEHSLNVYKCTIKLIELYEKLMTERGTESIHYSNDTVIISTLLHDLCKIQYYIKKQKFYKDEYGSWKSYTGYGIDDKFPFGHGEKSCFLAQRFIMLTGVEALAIRWHMGYEKDGVHLDGTEKKSLGDAWNKVPLAYLLHQADSMSAFLLEDMIESPNKK